MKQVILLKNRQARDNIEKTFGITRANLSQSLNFARNGDKNSRIRMMAMQNGGVLLREVTEWNNNDLK